MDTYSTSLEVNYSYSEKTQSVQDLKHTEGKEQLDFDRTIASEGRVCSGDLHSADNASDSDYVEDTDPLDNEAHDTEQLYTAESGTDCLTFGIAHLST